MDAPVPRHISRRIRPAVAANAALAVTLLALAVAGDVAPASGQPVVGAPDGEGVPAERAGGEEGGSPGEYASPHSQFVPTDPDAELADLLAPRLTDPGVRLSVSVLDPETGAGAGYTTHGDGMRRDDATFDTASIVKVDVLAALLLQAQDEDRRLTAWEEDLAASMIRRSDNDATDVLWREIGGAPGLDAANERLGLAETTAGGDGFWGLTQTTSEDQIALLEAVYGEESVLEPDSQAYLQELMGSVVARQRWGISAAADGDGGDSTDGGDAGDFELKNGWLPRSQTGLWDINSIGRVTVEGRSYLLAVVSDGHVGQAAGIRAVEAAAQAAVSALTGVPEQPATQDSPGS